jgi:DNA transformation protein
MPKDTSFHDYVMVEVFDKIPGITSRPMFGDHGVYKDGLFFAIIADGSLYFKAGDSNRLDYESAGSEKFTYQSHKGPMQMSYYEVPPEVLENPQELEIWVEKSVEAAKKAKKK